MNYTAEEVSQYVREEDVKFIRLAFCDVYGRQKNISVMPDELPRAFEKGIPFYPAAVPGYEGEGSLMLHPDPGTLSVLPWRPEHGRVVRMYSTVAAPDGTPHPADTRGLLQRTAEEAEKAGSVFLFGVQQTFYLFRLDGEGRPTKIPYDRAGYMDIAPEDRGENVRREICLTLEQMGIRPESSHHEEGPGQNKIDFRFSDALEAADNAMTFQTVVRTAAHRNGLSADFSPKPLADFPGNGCHINFSVLPGAGENSPERTLASAAAGILEEIGPMTAFLNPTENSYQRFDGRGKMTEIGWSAKSRSRLIWMPPDSARPLCGVSGSPSCRAELRSPDPGTNPYLALTLLIRAGLCGIEKKLGLPGEGGTGRMLPSSLDEAKKAAAASAFIRDSLPEAVRAAYGADRD
jgi:glutamine synthetase